jgi:hypothetical protein
MSLRRALLLASRLAVAGAFVSSASGCFAIDIVDLLEPEEKKKRKRKAREDDEAEPGATSLGRATFPQGTKKPVAKHAWTAKALKPDDYVLEYAMSNDAQEAVLAAHAAFAKKTGYTPMSEGRFRWIIPPGCQADMGCAFGVMSDASREALEPLAALFQARRKDAKLDAERAASLVVTFVQNIHYERPKDQPFEILPPANVVAEKRGDCDSKSLLAHLLLRELGIDSVMISSTAHAHAMLGIAIPTPGKRFSFGGRTYAFTELTAKNSPIGHINPELLRPDDWKVVPTRWPDASWRGR